MPTPTYEEFPDILPAILDALESSLTSTTVAEDLTGYHHPDKWVRVQFSGGSFINPHRIAAPRFDINVYAKTKPETMSLALKAVKAMYALKNHVGADFVVTNVECSYPQDLSDPINHNPRFVFDLVVNYRTR